MALTAERRVFQTIEIDTGIIEVREVTRREVIETNVAIIGGGGGGSGDVPDVITKSIQITGSLRVDNGIDVQNKKIQNVLTPTANNDAANKVYVDNIASTLTASISSLSSTVSGLSSSIAGLQPTSAKGQANGYAPLDGSSLVPVVNLPSSIVYQTELDNTIADYLPLIGGSVGPLDLTNNKISNLANPTGNQDAATKIYVDSRPSFQVKQAVRVATTVNGTLATAYENGATVDGVTLATDDRILLKNQTTQTENGIYVVQASGAPVRATDSDTGTELLNAVVFVSEGTVNGNSTWAQTTAGTITLGSTNIVWQQMLASSSYSAGSNLQLTGSQFSLSISDPIAMGTNKITGLGDPTSAQDASTKAYVDTSISSIDTFLPLVGGDLSGDLGLGDNSITDVANPIVATDAVNKQYSDAVFVINRTCVITSQITAISSPHIAKRVTITNDYTNYETVFIRLLDGEDIQLDPGETVTVVETDLQNIFAYTSTYNTRVMIAIEVPGIENIIDYNVLSLSAMIPPSAIKNYAVNNGNTITSDIEALPRGAGLRLMSFTAQAVNGNGGQFIIRNGENGTPIEFVKLDINETQSDTYNWNGLDASNGIYIDFVSGAFVLTIGVTVA